MAGTQIVPAKPERIIDIEQLSFAGAGSGAAMLSSDVFETEQTFSAAIGTGTIRDQVVVNGYVWARCENPTGQGMVNIPTPIYFRTARDAGNVAGWTYDRIVVSAYLRTTASPATVNSDHGFGFQVGASTASFFQAGHGFGVFRRTDGGVYFVSGQATGLDDGLRWKTSLATWVPEGAMERQFTFDLQSARADRDASVTLYVGRDLVLSRNWADHSVELPAITSTLTIRQYAYVGTQYLRGLRIRIYPRDLPTD